MSKYYLDLGGQVIEFDITEASCKKYMNLALDEYFYVNGDDDGSPDMTLWSYDRLWNGDTNDEGDPVVDTGEVDADGDPVYRDPDWDDDGWEWCDPIKLDHDILNELSGGRWNSVANGGSYFSPGDYDYVAFGKTLPGRQGRTTPGNEEIR